MEFEYKIVQEARAAGEVVLIFYSSETIDFTILSTNQKLHQKKYFKNFFTNIWQYQKNKFIFASQNKI